MSLGTGTDSPPRKSTGGRGVKRSAAGGGQDQSRQKRRTFPQHHNGQGQGYPMPLQHSIPPPPAYPSSAYENYQSVESQLMALLMQQQQQQQQQQGGGGGWPAGGTVLQT